MITKATSPGYLYSVTTDSTCIITDQDTKYNLCKALANSQGMFVAIGGVVECSDDNVILTQASTVSGGTRYEVLATRPASGEPGVIYLIPSSSSTTENMYEEWLWVNDKWEQVGSAGLNVSNFAQLTTANTFSNTNTFNGNLVKKTSSALADNSVLNRSEMDSRYGAKGSSNSWSNLNIFTNGIEADSATISSVTVLSTAIIPSIHVSHIATLHTLEGAKPVIKAGQLDITAGTGVRVLCDEIELLGKTIVIGSEMGSLDAHSKVSIIGDLSVTNGTLSAKRIAGYVDISIVSDLLIHDNNRLYAKNINVDRISHNKCSSISLVAPLTVDGNITLTKGHEVEADSMQAGILYTKSIAGVTAGKPIELYTNIAGTTNTNISISGLHCVTAKNISGLASLDFKGSNQILANGYGLLFVKGITEFDSRISTPSVNTNGGRSDGYDDLTNLSYAVLDANGIRYVSDVLDTAPAQFDTRGVKSCMLPAETFGEDKWGVKIDHSGCQLFGIDFMFGDAWTYAQDYATAYGATITYPLTAPTSVDLVKINKPGVSIGSDDKAYLSFDYANQVYIRSFPNDGGQALFEFQGGHWTDDNPNNVKLGAVDIRKMSAETLHPTSLLNMAEGDARWGSGGSDYMKVATNMWDARGVSIEDGYYRGTGVGIGAQVDLTNSDIVAIGARIDAQSQGNPHKITMLGYQLAAAGPTASRMIALGGYAKTTGYIHVYNGAISIGYSDHYDSAKEGSVVIGNNAQARSSFGTAIGADAIASGVHSLSLGLASYADATYGIALGGQSCAAGTRTIAIGSQTKAYGAAALCIGSEAKIGTDAKWADGSTALGPVANCASIQSVAVGGWSTIGTSANGATALGYTARVYNSSRNGIAIGCNAAVGDKSIAIGANAEAIHGSIVIGANGKAIFPGILISNIGNDNNVNGLGQGGTRDTGICLSAAAVEWTPNSIIFELSSNSTRSADEAVIFRSIDDKFQSENYGHCSREAFASILNNARLGNYPAQPFVEVTPLHIDKLYSLQPNTVYHVQISPTIEPEPLDLSRLAFDLSVTGIPTAELHIVTNDNRNISNIIWPSNMLWPDEAEQTVAPAIETPTDKIRCYVFTVRRQIIYGTEYLIGALAYKLDV